MPILNLNKLFYPRSVAVVGASNREGVTGQIVMQNLLHGGFEGPIMPVSNDERAISGVLAYPGVEALPETPDLAVFCDDTAALPTALQALAERGTRAAILLSDGLGGKAESRAGGTAKAVLREAERVGLRILGPDCLGLMVPHIGLNASVAPVAASPGGVAFVSQSSTVCAAVLDWAHERDIGFSHFVSLGKTFDIDLADVIDYLGNDAMTRAILIYVEWIRNGRRFMSAGRGASRNKPVLVIKAGRTAEGQRAVRGIAEAAGTDDVYDAAIRRAGMLRVHGFSELFAAVETLGRSRLLRGERLAIVSNGAGIAVMAVDNLVLSGGRLAPLSYATLQAIGPHVSGSEPPSNPVHLDEDATPDRYAATAKAALADNSVDAVLVLHAPSSAVPSVRVADAVIRAAKETRGAVLASFMGGKSVSEARRMLGDARIPTFDTVNQAVDAFMHMVRFRRNQELLMQTPPSKPTEFVSGRDDVRAMVGELLRRGQSIVTGREAKTLLAAFGIKSAEARIVKSAEDAAQTAEKMGFPVALKVISRDAPVRGEFGGVEMFLESGAAVRTAAQRLLANAAQHRPRSPVQGLTIERMMARAGTREVRIGVSDDAVFGPVIVFGHGGSAADVIDDHAVGLPPLNMALARELIERTRVYRLLQGYGDVPCADLDGLCLMLVQVSQLVVDIPEIAALDINPVLVDENGVLAVDAQVLIAPPTEATERRLAIRPYPQELEETFELRNGRQVLLRPIRPEDEPAHHEFLSKCSPEDMRLRFFHLVRSLPHAEMARLTQIDYDREMAFIASTMSLDDSGPETLGVVRTVADLHNDKAEYAIMVRSDLKGQRLGWKLMEKIIRYCRSRGTRRIVGLVLRDNVPMLDLVHSLGFRSRKVPDDDVMEVELDLFADA
jgi:Acyl-CoA synthetase (NDP forming)